MRWLPRRVPARTAPVAREKALGTRLLASNFGLILTRPDPTYAPGPPNPLIFSFALRVRVL
jgi:hypothetical protein